MDKVYVTESADELFKMAELDIMSVDTLTTAPKYPVDLMSIWQGAQI